MEINKPERDSVVGELLIKEKYKFIQNGLIGAIVHDAFDELERLENDE